jgi:hypothetical protein
MSKIFDTEQAMAFREKSAWISLCVTLCAYGAYFFNLAGALLWGRSIGLVAWLQTLVALIVVQAALHIVLAALSPKDAQAPEDERERLIAVRASAVAFYILLIGVLSVATMGYFLFDKLGLGSLVVAAAGVAQTAQYAGVIIGHRRGG